MKRASLTLRTSTLLWQNSSEGPVWTRPWAPAPRWCVPALIWPDCWCRSCRSTPSLPQSSSSKDDWKKKHLDTWLYNPHVRNLCSRNCLFRSTEAIFIWSRGWSNSVAPGCVFCIRRAPWRLRGFFSLTLGCSFLWVTANWLSFKAKSRPSYTAVSQTRNDVPSVFQLLPESLNDDGAKQDKKSREDQWYDGHHLLPGGRQRI